MKRLLFTVSYDGSDYSGFQRQVNSKSIQEEIEKAIKRMTRLDVNIQSAGRTDKGVHANNQTFHFDTDLEIELNKWIIGLNKRLPSDIIILDVKEVNASFHARHSAKSREYYYYIAKNPSSIYSQRYEVYVENFNLEKANLIKEKFIGTKDFRAFSKYSIDKDPIRTLNNIVINETNNHYIFIFEGVSFLRYMVRSIMGTIMDYASNNKDISEIDKIFETNDRKLVSKTAEAKALVLNKINY